MVPVKRNIQWYNKNVRAFYPGSLNNVLVWAIRARFSNLAVVLLIILLTCVAAVLNWTADAGPGSGAAAAGVYRNPFRRMRHGRRLMDGT